MQISKGLENNNGRVWGWESVKKEKSSKLICLEVAVHVQTLNTLLREKRTINEGYGVK